jgi:hypothetical protein
MSQQLQYVTHPLHKDVAYRIVSAYSVDVDRLMVTYEPLLRRARAPLYARNLSDYRAFGELMTGVWSKAEYARLEALNEQK